MRRLDPPIYEIYFMGQQCSLTQSIFESSPWDGKLGSTETEHSWYQFWIEAEQGTKPLRRFMVRTHFYFGDIDTVGRDHHFFRSS